METSSTCLFLSHNLAQCTCSSVAREKQAEEDSSQTSNFHWLIKTSFFDENKFASEVLSGWGQSSHVAGVMQIDQKSRHKIRHEHFSNCLKWQTLWGWSLPVEITDVFHMNQGTCRNKSHDFKPNEAWVMLVQMFQFQRIAIAPPFERLEQDWF